MQITALSVQQKNKDRINVIVDGAYRFSLDIFQVGELGIKVGREFSEAELVEMETESQFGKLYARALEYTFMRPHSAKEIRDYLYRKTRDSRTKTGELKAGVPAALTERVFERLSQKGYINDEKFARFFIENRNLRKGISQRKLVAELRAKGIDQAIIINLLGMSERTDDQEIQKIITKKRARYPDEQKLMRYLAGQGFSYDAIKQALEVETYN